MIFAAPNEWDLKQVKLEMELDGDEKENIKFINKKNNITWQPPTLYIYQ